MIAVQFYKYIKSYLIFYSLSNIFSKNVKTTSKNSGKADIRSELLGHKGLEKPQKSTPHTINSTRPTLLHSPALSPTSKKCEAIDMIQSSHLFACNWLSSFSRPRGWRVLFPISAGHVLSSLHTLSSLGSAPHLIPLKSASFSTALCHISKCAHLFHPKKKKASPILLLLQLLL